MLLRVLHEREGARKSARPTLERKRQAGRFKAGVREATAQHSARNTQRHTHPTKRCKTSTFTRHGTTVR